MDSKLSVVVVGAEVTHLGVIDLDVEVVGLADHVVRRV
jgi:hypothetical protein